MAWENELFALFEDLEGQAEALYADDREAELVDRSRAEYAGVLLTGRLMASVGRSIEIDVRGVGPVRGQLARVARSWCLVSGHGQEWFVPRSAITTITGASAQAVPEVAWSPLTRLGIGSALRRIADSGDRCLVHTAEGARHDVVLRRVAADFVEAISGEGRSVLLVLDSVCAVQRRD